MKRDLTALTEREYDLVIVGAGIFGAIAAWDAALRGLQVAIIDKGDFCQATSANHFKMVHGGIRYLQHGDLYRMRESNRERNILLRVAPHLVQPLPVVIPTFGRGMQGKEILRLGLMAYELITFDRNKGLSDPCRRLPRSRVISRYEFLELFPEMRLEDLTGAAIFYDGQMYNPPRLVLSFIRSAVRVGAHAGNYVEVKEFLRKGDRVFGVKVRDRLEGSEFEIRAKVVINAAGPWAEQLLRVNDSLRLNPELSYSRDACFVMSRRFNTKYALSVQGRTADPDAFVSRKHRHLFIVPWREYTLIGVWHVVHRGSPDDFTVTGEELQSILDEINEACPPLGLTLADVAMSNAGLVLFGSNRPGATDLSYGKRSKLVDHSREHHIAGLITMIGVRATTARGVAKKAVDLVFRKLGKKPPPCGTSVVPIFGGQIEYFEDFMTKTIQNYRPTLGHKFIRPLVHSYGSEFHRVLKYVGEERTFGENIEGSCVLKAEVVHAVREEMAQKLADVVFRRTDLGTGGHPGEEALQTSADLMASEMGWDVNRVQMELDEVRSFFPNF